ncbi:hypothetical protein BC830DRAFT_1129701 [Chytriomyces sp. MP71]|nr:hypothetical protein BC830DRAFT_1129701 [Chytriomyces sp. MP71]
MSLTVQSGMTASGLPFISIDGYDWYGFDTGSQGHMDLASCADLTASQGQSFFTFNNAINRCYPKQPNLNNLPAGSTVLMAILDASRSPALTLPLWFKSGSLDIPGVGSPIISSGATMATCVAACQANALCIVAEVVSPQGQCYLKTPSARNNQVAGVVFGHSSPNPSSSPSGITNGVISSAVTTSSGLSSISIPASNADTSMDTSSTISTTISTSLSSTADLRSTYSSSISSSELRTTGVSTKLVATQTQLTTPIESSSYLSNTTFIIAGVASGVAALIILSGTITFFHLKKRRREPNHTSAIPLGRTYTRMSKDTDQVTSTGDSSSSSGADPSIALFPASSRAGKIYPDNKAYPEYLNSAFHDRGPSSTAPFSSDPATTSKKVSMLSTQGDYNPTALSLSNLPPDSQTWNARNVCRFLSQNGVRDETVARFREARLDGRLLRLVTLEVLSRELGIEDLRERLVVNDLVTRLKEVQQGLPVYEE